MRRTWAAGSGPLPWRWCPGLSLRLRAIPPRPRTGRRSRRSACDAEASLSNSGATHPPRSNPPLRSSSAAPSPCITPSTVTIVMVVSFMVAPLDLAVDGFFGEDGIDLADGLAQSLVRAPGQGLLHGLGAGEHDL